MKVESFFQGFFDMQWASVPEGGALTAWLRSRLATADNHSSRQRRCISRDILECSTKPARGGGDLRFLPRGSCSANAGARNHEAMRLRKRPGDSPPAPIATITVLRSINLFALD